MGRRKATTTDTTHNGTHNFSICFIPMNKTCHFNSAPPTLICMRLLLYESLFWACYLIWLRWLIPARDTEVETRRGRGRGGGGRGVQRRGGSIGTRGGGRRQSPTTTTPPLAENKASHTTTMTADVGAEQTPNVNVVGGAVGGGGSAHGKTLRTTEGTTNSACDKDEVFHSFSSQRICWVWYIHILPSSQMCNNNFTRHIMRSLEHRLLFITRGGREREKSLFRYINSDSSCWQSKCTKCCLELYFPVWRVRKEDLSQILLLLLLLLGGWERSSGVEALGSEASLRHTSLSRQHDAWGEWSTFLKFYSRIKIDCDLSSAFHSCPVAAQVAHVGRNSEKI